MAHWREVVRTYPEVRDYIRHRRWSRRGDVVTYAPDQRNEMFSTDAYGFRLSEFQGREYGIKECIGADRYGLVMGSSHVFGFGLPGNAATLPSQLSSALGFPMANISFPEADTRTHHAVLTNILCSQSSAPAVIVLLTGGDFTRFAFSAEADPVFGSRNVEDAGDVENDHDALGSVSSALAFSSLWTRAVIKLARSAGVPIVLVDDVTFMEKAQPSLAELTCGLGTAGGASQLRRFEHQRRFGGRFFSMRRQLAGDMDVPLPIISASETQFIDEFHYDATSIKQMSIAIGSEILNLLKAEVRAGTEINQG